MNYLGCLWVCERVGCDVFALWDVFPIFPLCSEAVVFTMPCFPYYSI